MVGSTLIRYVIAFMTVAWMALLIDRRKGGWFLPDARLFLINMLQ